MSNHDDHDDPPHPEGGWGDGGSDDDYGGLPLVPELAPASAGAAGAAAPPPDAFREWVEVVAFQVGNAAHEVRNALRFWSSMVTVPEGDGARKAFRKADNTSGQLEGTMRALVGRVRNVPQVARPLGNLLPKGRRLLEQIKADVRACAHPTAAAQQATAIGDLVDRQDAYLTVLEAALQAGCRPPPQCGAPPHTLPPPGKRIDFGAWPPATEAFFAEQSALAQRGETVGAASVIGVARLACNTAHELQNLSVAPHGGAGSDAHGWLKKLDGLAGKCENAARAGMVCAHASHTASAARMQAKMLQKLRVRAAFLATAAARAQGILAAAEGVPGAATIPAGAIALAAGRLARLAALLESARLPGAASAAAHPQARAARSAAAAAGARCAAAGCAYAVTGITPRHCCKACEKSAGRHGPRCQKRPAAQGGYTGGTSPSVPHGVSPPAPSAPPAPAARV